MPPNTSQPTREKNPRHERVPQGCRKGTTTSPAKKEQLKRLGKIIATARTKVGWSQFTLGNEAKIHEKTVYNIENGLTHKGESLHSVRMVLGKKLKDDYGETLPWPSLEDALALQNTSDSNPIIALSRIPLLGRKTGYGVLIGRDHERKALDCAWEGDGASWQQMFNQHASKGMRLTGESIRPRVIVFNAWAGIGKTSLVVRWASDKLAKENYSGIERYFDWSFYNQGTRPGDRTEVSTNTSSADLFLKEALDFFGDKVLAASNASAWQKGERLAKLVGQYRTLLVLDGLEPLQDARTGELGDDGLRALLLGLITDSRGLCLITTRQHLPELAHCHPTTAPEWKLDRLSDEAGCILLTELGVNGPEQEKRDLSARVKGHALTLSLLGGYLRHAHHGDIRYADQLDFQKVIGKEQGGHAFRVIAAYESWFKKSRCRTELAILRMLGLFDRRATPDCLSALREPPITGLTDVLATIDDEEWNEAVAKLIELGLVEEQAWEPCQFLGYSEVIAKTAMDANFHHRTFQLGEPLTFDPPLPRFGMRHSIDTHPLIREYFTKQLQKKNVRLFKAMHLRIFKHLQTNVPFWPEGLDALQPLFQAITHGCKAGLHQQTCDLYYDRIARGYDHYSWKALGCFGSDLEAVSCFFVKRWSRVEQNIKKPDQAWLLNEVAFCLRALGRLTQAVEPMQAGLQGAIENEEFQEAALRASNLCELQLTLGDVSEAFKLAEQCVALADNSDDAFWKMASRVTLGDALHQAGRRADALLSFRKAERMQRKREPQFPLIFGWWSFLYTECLLAGAEREAWRQFMWTNGKLHSSYRWSTESANGKESGVTEHLESCRAVHQRTTTLLEWRKLPTWSKSKDSLLATSLYHLTIGRALLYESILDKTVFPSNGKEIDIDANGLRLAGHQDDLPRGLLTRAWLRVIQDEHEMACADLEESQNIVERGPMRLHLADVHLHRARLFRDKKELNLARRLIDKCGYLRRKAELEDAEDAAKIW